MASLVGASLLVVGFVGILKALGLVERSRRVMMLGRQATNDLRSPDMDDLQKEKALQGHSLRLFGLFFQLAAGGAAAVLMPAVMVWLLAQAGLFSFDAVMELAVSWEFLVGSMVVAGLALKVIGRP